MSKRELLAEASTEAPGKERWTELRLLWDEDESGFVLEGCGRTTVPGEEDREWSRFERTGAGVLLALTRKSDDEQNYWYLSRVAHRLLTEAGKREPEIKEALRLYQRTPFHP